MALPVQASFAEKLTLSMDGDHSLLPLVGNNRDLDLSGLEVKQGVRAVPLGEHQLTGRVLSDRVPVAG